MPNNVLTNLRILEKMFSCGSNAALELSSLQVNSIVNNSIINSSRQINAKLPEIVYVSCALSSGIDSLFIYYLLL